MSFYRKYRPQSLQELTGQNAIKQLLEKAYSEDKLSHAYLFCGPRGTGKTSTARILAKMVNCEQNRENPKQNDPRLSAHNPQPTPCNQCLQCLSITDGSNLDFIEIDAASNRGIDDIRALRENIKLSPTAAKKKVYIIDEVHMLTTEAFNALLKTLEEPPDHVLFILATTELQKIPQTILSRVQKLDFTLASNEDLLRVLKTVAEKEKLEIDEKALSLIAKKGEGSFRDALKILDSVSAFKKIDVKTVEESIQSTGFSDLIEILEAIAEKKSQEALNKVLRQVALGANIKDFILSLMDIIRAVLLIQQKAETVVKKTFDEDYFKAAKKLSTILNTTELIFYLRRLQEAYENSKNAAIPSLPLEIAIIECCAITEKNNSAKPAIPEPVSAVVPEVKPTAQKSLVEASEVSNSDDWVILKEKWNYVLETVKPYNYSLEALLRSVKIVECSEGKIVVEVPYSFHQRILETPKSRDLLESVISEVLGKAVKIKVVLGKRPVRVEDIANVEVAADDEIVRIAQEIFSTDSA